MQDASDFDLVVYDAVVDDVVFYSEQAQRQGLVIVDGTGVRIGAEAIKRLVDRDIVVVGLARTPIEFRVQQDVVEVLSCPRGETNGASMGRHLGAVARQTPRADAPTP